MIKRKSLLIIESVLIMSLSIVWLTIIAISATRAYQVKIIKSSTTRLPVTPIIGDSSTSQEKQDLLRAKLEIFFKKPDAFEKQYGHFPEQLRVQSRNEVRQMFEFGYDSYMTHAFPFDELDPIHCIGRGPDFDNPSNININDVLGNYSLTLIDTLDTLAVLGNATEFKRAVQLVIDTVSFDSDHNVQVFEANIRILGALISSHLLIEDETKPFGDLRPAKYSGQLLDLAHDLATRLLPAFDSSQTGIPYPRVNLRHGLPTTHLCDYCATQTCTAGAGSLLLEFGLLSKLIDDPVFEAVARRAAKNLWMRREKSTGLLGNVIDVETGEWVNKMSGIGAGIDSFYEYLLKSYVLFGEIEDFRMFNESYTQIKRHLRRGRAKCNEGNGNHPVYVNVNMLDGSTTTLWIDSLQAAFAGVQVMSGDVEEAICQHALYFAIWKRYGALPERFNWQRLSPDVSFYPLRPELIESTYLLYQATKNPFYLHVGREILDSLNKHTKVKCGYATIHNVEDMTLEDRMESFFLSETCKYLYLLFDEDNPLNKHPTKYVFTTEGHVFPVRSAYRKQFWENAHLFAEQSELPLTADHLDMDQSLLEATNIIDKILDREELNVDILKHTNLYKSNNDTQNRCDRIDAARTFDLPLKSVYFNQLTKALNSN